jgi:7-cyano-7-deazaguanine synthase in queuosine biosynthesis
MRFARFVGKTNRNLVYRAALRDGSIRKMDFRPAEGNITLDFTVDGERLALPMAPVVRDLIDLATIVYTADELCARTAGADRWSRGFKALIPVRAPGAWRKASPQLEELLYFLSGDKFQFEWVRTKAVPRLRNHRATVPEGFDTVCLFSGGADSLVGAYELLASGKKVLLVGHQADGITASTQDRVYRFFKKRFGDHVAFVQARVARSPRENPEFPLGEKVETTHRPRSFLFLSLAVAVAAAGEIDEIVIPENGLIALNPPLDASRVGTLSTRTAHPRFIAGFQTFAGMIGVFTGQIHNPFLYLSKTDVIRRTPRGLRPLLRQTVSCSHLGRNRWTGFRGHHCGYCIPCLYRRAAFSTLDLDDPGDYYRNVFTRFNSLTSNERSDIRALSRFARRVEAMTPAERVGAVVAHGACEGNLLAGIGPEVADPYGAWSEMLDRWADDFLSTARSWTSRDVRRRLAL